MSRFTFIDLFAGIGGFHLGMSRADGKCLLASEIDKTAAATYKANFHLEPLGDICEINEQDLPDFDVLCGGFPCQSFSNVGQKGGLEDARGALIYEVIRILKWKQPKAFVLENVKGLLSHNQGRTFETVKSALEESGYVVKSQILEAKDYGLPQIRKRLFFVGIRSDIGIEFKFPEPTNELDYSLAEVLGGKVKRQYGFTVRIGGRKSGINNRYNWDAYYVNDEVQHITPDQCLRLQGFPKDFKVEGGISQQYKQAGNAVPVNVVKVIAQNLVKLGIV